MTTSSNATVRPPWPRKKLQFTSELREIKQILRAHDLRSVCEDARCPNISECFSRREATFIILGDTCTRRCGFCAIPTGRPEPVDGDEPRRLAIAARDIGLRHIVITSVARDDLLDGGAQQFADCIREIRQLSPGTTVEVLTPDFKARPESLRVVADADLQVFNHNMETTEALHRKVRPQAKYDRSLTVLQMFKSMRPDVLTKSGFMLGLGETDEDVEQMMRDMHDHDIDIVTIGHYMQPMKDQLDVQSFSTLDRFRKFEEYGKALGFRLTVSGPYVRSSFGAADAARALGVLNDKREFGPEPQMHG